MSMGNRRLITVTDDLTGAADSGSYFTNREMDLTIYTGLEPEKLKLPEKGNISINLSTRNASSEAAYRRHFEMFRRLGEMPEREWVMMKKIGTGFRGQDPYEINGMLDANPRLLCFIVNSAPDLNTFTLYGSQYCEGCILTKSLYARDPVFPPNLSYIPDILGQGLKYSAAVISIDAVKGGAGALLGAVKDAVSAGNRVLVFDAITKEDGYYLVSTLAPLFPTAVWTGSLGIGEALAHYLTEKTQAIGEAHRRQGSMKRCISFSASAYEATKRQIAFSEVLGLEKVEIQIDRLIDGERGACTEAVTEFLEKLEVDDSKAGSAILVPKVEKYSRKEGVSRSILNAVSECAVRICQQVYFDRLVIIGGETAQSILKGLDIHIIRLLKSPEVGVAVGVIGDGIYKGKEIALKGGSIGSDHAIERMMGRE